MARSDWRGSPFAKLTELIISLRASHIASRICCCTAFRILGSVVIAAWRLSATLLMSVSSITNAIDNEKSRLVGILTKRD